MKKIIKTLAFIAIGVALGRASNKKAHFSIEGFPVTLGNLKTK